MKFYLSALLSAAALLAQSDQPGSISYGFKIGSALNDPISPNSFNGQYTFNQSRWTGGPTVEVRLPFRFAIEVDALYWSKRTTSTSTFHYGGETSPFSTSHSERTRSWDFPLLLKYRIPVSSSLRPFLSAGYQFTHESRTRDIRSQCLGPSGSCVPATVSAAIPDVRFTQIKDSRFHNGPAAGAGLEFRTKHVTITPELRWSRNINTYPRDNRFTGMVGFTFGRKH